MTEIACPICNGGALVRGEGKLEQSGDSYLPTVVWSCGCCGYARYEPARGMRWQPACDTTGAGTTSGTSGTATPLAPAQPLRPPAPAVKSRQAA
jgi:hypothetical protein